MLKKIIITIVVILVIIVACFIVPNINTNSPESTRTEYLLIPENSSLSTVVDSLNQKESVVSSLTFYVCAYMVGYQDKIKVGRFALKDGLNNLFLLNNLIKGRQEPIRITFNNIRTKEQLCGRLSNQLMLDSLELLEALNNNDTLQQYGLNTNTATCLFIPNTYEVYWTIPMHRLLEKMNTAYSEFWNDERLAKAISVNLSPIEVSILASIVEEESNLAEEKPIIAGLYLNRLHSDIPLQADPTIKFALGDFTIKRVLFKHIEETKASPYNTYINKGLPPGPIRVPSIESIDAVLNFKKHPYFFMCAKGSGGNGHDFAVSFQEHLQNANRYRNTMNILGVK